MTTESSARSSRPQPSASQAGDGSQRIHAVMPDGARRSLEGGPVPFSNLADLLISRGLPLDTRCGHRGLCRGCSVRLVSGSLMHQGKRIASPATVRSCQCQSRGADSLTLEIPASSLLGHRAQVVDQFEINVPFRLSPPSFAQDKPLGLAIDIGTTTIALLLVDLSSGEIIARASDFNRQIRRADNVLSRIQLCSHQPSSLAALQRDVVHGTLNPLIHQVAQRAKRELRHIGCATISGNTTMLHLLAGEDPTPMGIAPFTPRFLQQRLLEGSEIGLPIAVLSLLPGIAAYVGADLVAGIYATGLHYDEGPALLVDIGTNGEIIYRHGERFLATATAAGPAFEGGGLTSGTRAADGAVSRIELQADPFQCRPQLIGRRSADQAIGICGSAYIDFLAEGRRIGLLAEHGRFERDFWDRMPTAYRVSTDTSHSFRLSQNGRHDGIGISEADLAALLQAKAAIAAGIQTILEKDGQRPQDVRRLYLAGGFGLHLSIPHAIQCGLLPGFRQEQIKIVGNSALAGAFLALLDQDALPRMSQLASAIATVELNQEPSFEDHYIDALSLP